MIKNGSNNKTSIVKSEPEISSECQNPGATHNDMLTLHKEMGLSPLNYDYDNVDIESINIDDIFNESHSNPNWCSNKDENDDISKYGHQLINENMDILSNVYNNPGETNSLSFCNSNQDLCLMSQDNKLNSNLDDNKMFLITDILSKDKFYLNSPLDPILNSTSSVTQQNYENKPQLPLLLNLCHVCTDSSIHPHHGVYNNESVLNRSKINSNNINANVIQMSNPNSACTTLSKTKTILPVIGPSPRNRYLSMKTGKMLSQLCSICNDNATGKHYGVISCEGCKGFFKRTIRNGLSYTCRDFNNCSVDKKFRNRCQSCRFQKCQQVGMKREAVQIERPEKRGQKSIPDNGDTIMSSPSSAKTDESLEKIHSNLIGQINSEYMIQIEVKCNPEVEEREIFEGNVMKVIYQHVNDHLFCIVSWAKYMPGFTMLSLNDQTLLIKMCTSF